MALKPTIYKLRIALSDLERNHYDTLNLTVAMHPSETPERMTARVLAFCLNAQKNLLFTKGLSAIDEPDLWVKTMDDKTTLWVDVGEPDPDRVKKSVRKAEHVKVYSFNTKSDVWWSQGKNKFAQYEVEIIRFHAEAVSKLASQLERTVDWSVTITGQSAFVACRQAEVEVNWETLQELSKN